MTGSLTGIVGHSYRRREGAGPHEQMRHHPQTPASSSLPSTRSSACSPPPSITPSHPGTPPAGRDRPDRASPRKTRKAGDFPARKPGEPSVANVTRRIEFHLLYPWQII